jgi:hypothetical protein
MNHLTNADSLLGWFSTLKTEVIRFSGKLGSIRTTRYIPEDGIFRKYLCKNLKSYKRWLCSEKTREISWTTNILLCAWLTATMVLALDRTVYSAGLITVFCCHDQSAIFLSLQTEYLKLKLILWPTVSRPVNLGVGHPYDATNQILIFLCLKITFLSSSCRVPSLTIGWVCSFEYNHLTMRVAQNP